MTKRSIAVTVLIETDDQRLWPENLDVSTPAKTARLRQAVIDNLGHLTRVVVLMSEQDCRMMMAAHSAGMRALGAEDKILYPPAGYVPPTRD